MTKVFVLTRSFFDLQKWVFCDGADGQTDIATLWEFSFHSFHSRGPVDSGPLRYKNHLVYQLNKKNLFQIKMAEEREKCKYFNSGYFKYKTKCRYLHPKEECKDNCTLKSCMKRHVKTCKFRSNCRHKEKCAYKHFTDKNKINIDGKDKLA